MSTTVEVCVGCGHPIGLHYNDVTGVARCLWKKQGTTDRGVIGMPYTQTCKCENFAVPTPDAK